MTTYFPVCYIPYY